MDSSDSISRMEIAQLRRMFEFYQQSQADILKHRSDFANETAQRVSLLESGFCRLLQLLRVLIDHGNSQGWLKSEELIQRLQAVTNSDADQEGTARFLQAFGFAMSEKPTSLYSILFQLGDCAAPTSGDSVASAMPDADPVNPIDFLKSLEAQ